MYVKGALVVTNRRFLALTCCGLVASVFLLPRGIELCSAKPMIVEQLKTGPHIDGGSASSGHAVPASYLSYARTLLKNSTGYRKDLLTSLINMDDDLGRLRVPRSYVFNAGSKLVFPISFSIPEEHILHRFPSKSKPAASVVPGNHSTYIYMGNSTYEGDRHLERDFYYDLSSSMFAFTFKKAGWDCMRHLEIMARGCLPIFTDIGNSPNGTLMAYPKRVFSLLLRFPGLVYSTRPFQIAIVWEEFDHVLYMLTCEFLLSYTRKHLTTASMAKYVIDTVGLPTKTILFLATAEAASGDYLTDMTLHGFKTILGASAVVDVERQLPIYTSASDFNETEFIKSKSQLYGRGFTFGKTMSEYPGLVDRTRVPQRVQAHEFDLVVFGMGHRSMGLHAPFFKEVCRHYPPKRVVMLYGGDEAISINALNQWTSCVGHVFAREMY